VKLMLRPGEVPAVEVVKLAAEVLGRCWAGAGQVLGRCAPGQVSCHLSTTSAFSQRAQQNMMAHALCHHVVSMLARGHSWAQCAPLPLLPA
jgi:hypothetical protein